MEYRAHTIKVTCLGFIDSQHVQCSVDIYSADGSSFSFNNARVFDTEDDAHAAARTWIDERLSQPEFHEAKRKTG